MFTFIQDVAGRVEPVQQSHPYQHADFRNTPAIVKGIGSNQESDYVPPVDSTRIREQLEKVREFLLTYQLHPVEEGAFVYFHIARIQPFEHGNKRTASIAMNAIHELHGYPHSSRTT